MQIFLFIVYMVLGLIIAIPYTYLASGEPGSFVVTMWCAPAVVLLTIVLRFGEKREWVDPRRRRINNLLRRCSFWLVIYFCLPIILNGVSVLVKAAGYPVAGEWIFVSRFFSLWVVPLILFVGAWAYVGIVKLCRCIPSGTGSPPPNQPPSNYLKDAHHDPSKDGSTDFLRLCTAPA